MLKTYRRNNSGEIDVFKAELYFSEGIDKVGFCTPRAIKEETTNWRTERRSLDTTVIRATKPPQFQPPQKVDKRIKDKKNKHPSSPGGKLAQLLNTLFQQAVPKKKSKFVTSSHSVKDVEIEGKHPGRRSSISSCERTANKDYESKPKFYSVRNIEFANYNPSYSCSSSSDQKSYLSWGSSGRHREFLSNDKRVGSEYSTSQKGKLINSYSSENNKWSSSRSHTGIVSKHHSVWCEEFMIQNAEADDYDCGGSESSSDLFELKNYDLSRDVSSDLRLYGTTNLEIISNRTGVAY